ncbi:MAG: HlyD family secretion protein [Planctomycetaceae bacterium]
MNQIEAANAATDNRSGADAPAPPFRLLVLATLALGLGVGAARFLETRGDRPVAAYVQVRTTFVTADRTCRVLQLQQAAGDRITIGDPLVAYADADLEQQLVSIQQHIETFQKELCQAEARSRLELAHCQQSLDDRICQVQLQMTDYRQSRTESEMKRSVLAELLASKQSALWGNGDSLHIKSILFDQIWPNSERLQTSLQLETYTNQSELLAANIQICETRLESLRSMRSGIGEQVRESCGVPLTALKLEQAQQQLKRLEERQTQLSVVSPAVGQVGVYRSRPGDVLQPGDPIVELLDDSQRYLVAEVPSTRITEFKVGRTVSLIFPGNELRQGRVSRVAPQAGPRSADDPLSDPLVQVDIEPAGRLWPTVPIGTRIDSVAVR